ncbi:hypothetical protein GLX27_000626 [Malassezia furfur]|uniref:Mediator of RNA polymerase II transcription subunit 8 n=1 Tax=Malassezia furfur TaxID=55194 RepID=A0ABY8EK63_MALFU|nr:hypothetical protein GLX27_000626 [Malassezia furfur]
MSQRRGGGSTEPTLASAAPPLSHLMTLYQRYDSLRNSIALLREQTLHTPGIEDWLSVQSNYTNLLSHVFSIASALHSPSPHFVASQLATLNEFLETEAQDTNLFGDEQNDTEMNSLLQLPELAVHPCVPIPDSKLNWLGTLLRTVPEVETSAAESALVSDYDQKHAEVDEGTLTKQIQAHDDRRKHV